MNIFTIADLGYSANPVIHTLFITQAGEVPWTGFNFQVRGV